MHNLPVQMLLDDVRDWQQLVLDIEMHRDLDIKPEIQNSFRRLSKHWENQFDKDACETEINIIKRNYTQFVTKQEPDALINLLKRFIGICYKYYIKDEEKFNNFKRELQAAARSPVPPSRPAPQGATAMPSTRSSPAARVASATSQAPAPPPLVSVPPALRQQPATPVAASPPQMSPGRKFRNFLAGHRLALGIAALCILVIGSWSAHIASQHAEDQTQADGPGTVVEKVDKKIGQVQIDMRNQNREHGTNNGAGVGASSKAPVSHLPETPVSGDLLSESYVITAADKLFEDAKDIYGYHFSKAFLGPVPVEDFEGPQAIQLKEKSLTDSFRRLNNLTERHKSQVKEFLRSRASSAPALLQADLWSILIAHLEGEDPQLALESIRRFAEADAEKEKSK